MKIFKDGRVYIDGRLNPDVKLGDLVYKKSRQRIWRKLHKGMQSSNEISRILTDGGMFGIASRYGVQIYGESEQKYEVVA